MSTPAAPWNPVAEPWRVSIVFRGSQFPHGWQSDETTHATEAEARVKFEAPMPPYGSEAILDFAENGSAWSTRGRWRRIAKRRRRYRAARPRPPAP